MAKRWVRALLGGAALGLLSAGSANAVLIGNVEFPQGAVSFADSVISYQPGLAGADPGLTWQGAFNALGVPNFTGGNCTSQADCTYVSLGVGGALVLRFDNNVLTGSNNSDDDLWIFEIGPDVEDTTVDVSVDDVTWLTVGAVGGSTRGIDIDAFGYDSSSAFRYVRLIDVAGEGAQSGATVGADIDAVGAISTRAVAVVPEPGTWALMILGFGLAGAGLRARRGAVA